MECGPFCAALLCAELLFVRVLVGGSLDLVCRLLDLLADLSGGVVDRLAGLLGRPFSRLAGAHREGAGGDESEKRRLGREHGGLQGLVCRGWPCAASLPGLSGEAST